MSEEEKEVESVKKPEQHNIDQKPENILKPEEKKPVIEKPKKRHRLRTFLIVLAIIIIGLVIAIAATGLYEIPLLSSTLGANKPNDLGVKVSEEALNSMVEKIGIDIGNDISQFTVAGNKTYTGEMPLELTATSSELTSFLQQVNTRGDSNIFTDIHIKSIEGGLEISAMASQYIKAPVYAKVEIEKVTEKSINLELDKIKIGVFSVPDKYLKQIEDAAEELINERMAEVPGFSIETLEYHDSGATFKGTVPEKVESAPGTWL